MGLPAEAAPAVWIVVLNWNGLRDTLECLRSLGRLRYPNARVLVIDNGSQPSEADDIREACSSITVVRYPENRGYTGGSNAGIELALREGAEYVWLLNSDTTVEPDALAKLVAAGERNPKVGLLSPVIYESAMPGSIQFCGTFLDRKRGRQVSPRSLEEARAAAGNGPLLLWGTALLLKRAVIESVGVLDERYFAYHEDLDYSLRGRAAGFETQVVTESAVFHKTTWEAGSGDSPLREYLFVRNWFLLWRSYAVVWDRYASRRRFLAWTLDRALEAKGAGKLAVAEHALDGLWDALRGRWGSWEARGEMPRVLKRLILDGMFAWHAYAWIGLLAEGPLGALRRRRRRGCA